MRFPLLNNRKRGKSIFFAFCGYLRVFPRTDRDTSEFTFHFLTQSLLPLTNSTYPFPPGPRRNVELAQCLRLPTLRNIEPGVGDVVGVWKKSQK